MGREEQKKMPSPPAGTTTLGRTRLAPSGSTIVVIDYQSGTILEPEEAAMEFGQILGEKLYFVEMEEAWYHAYLDEDQPISLDELHAVGYAFDTHQVYLRVEQTDERTVYSIKVSRQHSDFDREE